MDYMFKKDLRLPFVKDTPVTSLSDYLVSKQKLDHEIMLGVANAKVLFANYAVIKSDFPNQWNRITKNTKNPEEAIDNWLLKNTAFISVSQAKSKITNTTIHTTNAKSSAWRPPRYGRAAILGQPEEKEESSPFLFDVKGTGVPPYEEPILPNSNGLMTLSEAVHEVMMEHLVYMSMNHANTDIRPLPSYAVIDLGFDALWLDGNAPERAVLLLRRTTTRPRFQWERFYQGKEVASALLEVELLLRKYGLTASNCGAVRFNIFNNGEELIADRDGKNIELKNTVKNLVMNSLKINEGDTVIVDGVNVQIAGQVETNPLSMRIMDFGRYRFCSQFNNELYSWIDADYQNLNGVFLSKKDKEYTQPDPILNLANTTTTPDFLLLDDFVKNYSKNDACPEELASLFRNVITYATAKLNS
ncbi:hypothetical protein [Aquimarina muelleri]|uniref:Uncharacterized protein n=2 Tax=Aquimarina muelleri TaxID=279356 RepID=A0A918N4F2_9FLAO|nr:hypothetical protein [Aquimarina muelleri]MCX2763980.1 hypothetical protein [Aquimarina muelleri]GGX22090.1 hypothetical protein GCM10007384_24120 [Aquimarina muelleri]